MTLEVAGSRALAGKQRLRCRVGEGFRVRSPQGIPMNQGPAVVGAGEGKKNKALLTEEII